MSKGIIWRIRNSRRERAEVTSAEITRSHHHATKSEMTYHYAFKVVLSGKRDELMKSDPACFIAALLCDTVIYRLPTEPALVFHETVVGMPWQRSRQHLTQFVHQSMKIFGSSYIFLLAGMLPIYEARRQKETSVLLGNYSFVFSLFFSRKDFSFEHRFAILNVRWILNSHFQFFTPVRRIFFEHSHEANKIIIRTSINVPRWLTATWEPANKKLRRAKKQATNKMWKD